MERGPFDLPGLPPISHAFLIDPTTGTMHCVAVEDAKAICWPSYKQRPRDWIATTEQDQSRVCARCLQMARGLKRDGKLRCVGLTLEDPQVEGIQMDPHDVPATEGRSIFEDLRKRSRPGDRLPNGTPREWFQ